MCVVYGMFLMYTDFVGGTTVINIYLILSTIYIFIAMSGCVGRGPSAFLGGLNAFKTACLCHK